MKRSFVVRPAPDGEHILSNVHQALGTLDRQKTWRVTIELEHQKRTLAQNQGLHALLRDLSHAYSEAYGEHIAPETWKTYYKRLRLGERTVELPNGQAMDVPRETSQCSVEEISNLIEFILFHAATELGIQLKAPDEYTADKASARG